MHIFNEIIIIKFSVTTALRLCYRKAENGRIVIFLRINVLLKVEAQRTDR